ncbi:hypothetical protein RHSIM_Rhsim02G0043500 [Rhododendron simsii]|uniref:Pre-mRNA-processing factor 19 n=1 Tax=Rhododendron simsii TaxID=118357 RepID=A0A834LU18_RHOSS|nr:hypothetical protein RHSIM_Rhsim02G0043500 [Rhododendron simsii]
MGATGHKHRLDLVYMEQNTSQKWVPLMETWHFKFQVWHFKFVSGDVPEEPVVSKKSGLLYEKRLIERHISDYGKCPITGEPLSMEDIVPIKTGKIVKPRPVQAASIPGMLGMFQIDYDDFLMALGIMLVFAMLFYGLSEKLEAVLVLYLEWDGLMLSNFALEQQLHTARQELSHALYQHDAACRVIARLKKERDEARSLLAQADRQMPMLAPMATTIEASALSNGKRGRTDEDMGAVGKKLHTGISASIIAELTDCNAALSQQRKKRQIPPTLAPIDAIERYTQLSSYPLHKTSKPGILSVDILYSKDIIATGGADTNAIVFDRPSGEILSTLSGHSKKVTSVKFVGEGDLVVTGSADKTVRLWQSSENGNYDCKHILKDHAAEVEDTSGSGGYTSAAFHPDGLILGTGTSESIVKIWDVKSQENVARFDGHVGAVTAMSFSENGYFLATAAHDGVKLWDLRKLRNFRTFSPYDENTPTQSVEFDHSGSYLAIAGSDIRSKQSVLNTNVLAVSGFIKLQMSSLSGIASKHSLICKATSVKFGPDAKYLAVGSMDRNLRIFGLPGDEDPAES